MLTRMAGSLITPDPTPEEAEPLRPVKLVGSHGRGLPRRVAERPLGLARSREGVTYGSFDRSSQTPEWRRSR